MDEGDVKRVKNWWREQGQGSVFQLPPEVTWKEEEYPVLRNIARKKLTAREKKAPAVGDRLRRQAKLTNDKAAMDDCAALLNANRTRNLFRSCEPVAIGSKPGCELQAMHSDCEVPDKDTKTLNAMMKNVPISCIRPLQDTRMPVYPHSHLPQRQRWKGPHPPQPVEAVVPYGYAIFIHGWCLHCGSHLHDYVQSSDEDHDDIDDFRSEVRLFAAFAPNSSSLDSNTHFHRQLPIYYAYLLREFMLSTPEDLEKILADENFNLKYYKGIADYPRLVRAMHWRAVLMERVRRLPESFTEQGPTPMQVASVQSRLPDTGTE